MSYSIRRDGARWLVFRGWECLASFDSKQLALEYIALCKDIAKDPRYA